jgi:hypothetical protein
MALAVGSDLCALASLHLPGVYVGTGMSLSSSKQCLCHRHQSLAIVLVMVGSTNEFTNFTQKNQRLLRRVYEERGAPRWNARPRKRERATLARGNIVWTRPRGLGKRWGLAASGGFDRGEDAHPIDHDVN